MVLLADARDLVDQHLLLGGRVDEVCGDGDGELGVEAPAVEAVDGHALPGGDDAHVELEVLNDGGVEAIGVGEPGK